MMMMMMMMMITMIIIICKQKLYLYETELVEIEFGVKWHEKGWYAIKPTNQPTNQGELDVVLKVLYGYMK